MGAMGSKEASAEDLIRAGQKAREDSIAINGYASRPEGSLMNWASKPRRVEPPIVSDHVHGFDALGMRHTLWNEP